MSDIVNSNICIASIGDNIISQGTQCDVALKHINKRVVVEIEVSRVKEYSANFSLSPVKCARSHKLYVTSVLLRSAYLQAQIPLTKDL